jgi:hypothetical protein
MFASKDAIMKAKSQGQRVWLKWYSACLASKHEALSSIHSPGWGRWGRSDKTTHRMGERGQGDGAHSYNPSTQKTKAGVL